MKKTIVVYGHDEVIHALKTMCKLTFTTKMVESLLLYHTEDKNLDCRKELYTKEASVYFKGTK